MKKSITKTSLLSYDNINNCLKTLKINVLQSAIRSQPPLEQGLRLAINGNEEEIRASIRSQPPLEQGLRQDLTKLYRCTTLRIRSQPPLEQGLRLKKQ